MPTKVYLDTTIAFHFGFHSIRYGFQDEKSIIAVIAKVNQ